MSEEPTPALEPKKQRELRKPYYLLRTPDNLGNYFSPQLYNTLKSPKEPLGRFLPKATLLPSDTQAKRGSETIEYDLTPYLNQDLRPLDHIGESEWRAFKKAAEDFCDPVGAGRPRVTPHELELRQAFKLPDPTLETDAYWTYGPQEDRKLLIFWGAEWKQGSSLKLVSPAPGTRSIVDCLESKIIDWSGRQRVMRDIIRDKHLPISRYIGTPVHSAKGELTAVMVEGKKVAAGKLKPLKRLRQSAINQFGSTAATFYSEARTDSGTLSDFESELRRAFMLPDPDKCPASWFSYGGRPLAVPSGKEPETDCLYLCEDSEIPLPPTDGRATADTIIDRLSERAAPVKLYAAVAASILVLLLAGYGYYEYQADRSGPEIVNVIAENNPNLVILVFNKPIDPATVEPVSNDDAEPQVRIRDLAGRRVEVRTQEPHPEDGRHIKLTVSNLKDGTTYTATVSRFTDHTRKRNPVEPGTSADFQFLDTEPPSRPLISAHQSDSNKLVLRFDKPLHPTSAQNPANYHIPGFRTVGAELEDEVTTLVLTVQRERPDELESGFIDGGSYDLTITTLTADNAARASIEEPMIIRDFRYVDLIPPAVVDIVPATQIELVIVFSEPLDPGSAQAPDNYTLRANDDNLIKVHQARLESDNRSVRLITDPLFNRIEYTLLVSNVEDRAQPEANRKHGEKPRTFHFTGQEDRSPPAVVEARATPDQRELRVDFDKVLNTATLDPANFTVTAETGGLVAVTQVRAFGPTGKQLMLQLDNSLTSAGRYTLNYSEVADRIGNVAEQGLFHFRTEGLVALGNDLKIMDVTVLSSSRISVTFNGELVRATAERPEHFRIEPDVVIAKVTLDPEQKDRVVVQLDENTILDNRNYTLTASFLKLAQVDWETQRPVARQFQPQF